MNKNAAIFRRGFVRIYKSVTTTPNLTVKAKGLLAGLAAIAYKLEPAHNRYTITATQKELSEALGITKDIFKTYMSELVKEGYVVIQHNFRHGTGGYRLTANTYIIVPYAFYYGAADKLPVPADTEDRNKRNRILAECASCKGYGTLSASVMCDGDVQLTSMAIYAYLCAFAGSESMADPDLDTIRRHLKINRDTYASNRAVLEKKGYITVRQTYNSNGHFDRCHIQINADPGKAEAPKRGFIAAPMRKKPLQENPTSKKDDRDNISINKQSSKGLAPAKTDTHKEKILSSEEITDKINGNRGLTEEVIGRPETAEAAAELITENITLISEPADEKVSGAFTEALKSVLTGKTRIKGETVTPGMIAEKVNRTFVPADIQYDIYDNKTCLEAVQASLCAFYETVIKPAYEDQLAKQEIRNPISYMMTLFWDKLCNTQPSGCSGYVAGGFRKKTSLPDLCAHYPSEIIESLFE